jgi:hypothetical protein
MSRKYQIATLLIIAAGFFSLALLQSARAERLAAGPDLEPTAALPTPHLFIWQDAPDPSLPEQSVSVGVNLYNPYICAGRIAVTNGTYTCYISITKNPEYCRSYGICGLRFPKKQGSYVITATYQYFTPTITDTEPHVVHR